jgi:hypothetical protein
VLSAAYSINVESIPYIVPARQSQLCNALDLSA